MGEAREWWALSTVTKSGNPVFHGPFFRRFEAIISAENWWKLFDERPIAILRIRLKPPAKDT